jgi:hypothetical protein
MWRLQIGPAIGCGCYTEFTPIHRMTIKDEAVNVNALTCTLLSGISLSVAKVFGIP